MVNDLWFLFLSWSRFEIKKISIDVRHNWSFYNNNSASEFSLKGEHSRICSFLLLLFPPFVLVELVTTLDVALHAAYFPHYVRLSIMRLERATACTLYARYIAPVAT